MNFLDIFNIVDFFQIFVERKNHLVLYKKPSDQFSLFIELYLYNEYDTQLILLH